VTAVSDEAAARLRTAAAVAAPRRRRAAPVEAVDPRRRGHAGADPVALEVRPLSHGLAAEYYGRATTAARKRPVRRARPALPPSPRGGGGRGGQTTDSRAA
jgi:hypothetical protein